MKKLRWSLGKRERVERAQIAVGVVCHVGNVRDRNEDAYACPAPCDISSRRGVVYDLIDPALGALFLVADGVGGSEEGQAASLLTAETVVSAYYGLPGAESVAGRLEAAVRVANERILAFATETRATASTTLTSLVCAGNIGFVAHVGDSRLYWIRRGQIAQLTQDHDLVGESVRSGVLTPEEAAESGLGNVITRSIGSQPDVIPDISEIKIESKDSFILCSDGLTRHVPDQEILRIVQRTPDPQHAAESLADLALKGGGRDNVTVMVLRSKGHSRPSPVFAVIQILALVVLLTGLIWSVCRITRQRRNSDMGAPVSPISTPTVLWEASSDDSI